MDCIVLAFKVVFPILVYVSIGYGGKLLKLYDDKTIKVANDLVFKIFLPCLLFYNIYSTKIEEILNIKLIIYTVTFIILLFCLLMVTVPRFIKENNKRGVFIQGVFRSNFVLFGLPVTTSILGENNGGLTSFAIAFVVPLYNILAVICLETFRNNKINIKDILKGICKNPLIISSFLGVIFLALNIKMPVIVNDVVRDLSKVATPLALIGLGGSFTFGAVKGNIKTLLALLMLKLVVVPVTAISISSFIFGFKGACVVTLISVFASPTAVSSFTMAEGMGGDRDLAAQTVVFTSIFSILTVFLIVATTKYLGLY